MESNFNGLKPEEEERLAILVEECGEVIQVIGKILRHGYDNYKPSDPNKETNRSKLEKELSDLNVSMAILWEKSDLDISKMASHYFDRLERYKSGGGYLHHTTVD